MDHTIPNCMYYSWRRHPLHAVVELLYLHVRFIDIFMGNSILSTNTDTLEITIYVHATAYFKERVCMILPLNGWKVAFTTLELGLIVESNEDILIFELLRLIYILNFCFRYSEEVFLFLFNVFDLLVINSFYIYIYI